MFVTTHQLMAKTYRLFAKTTFRLRVFSQNYTLPNLAIWRRATVPRKPQRQTTGLTPKDFHRRRAVRLLEGPFDLTLDGSVQFTHTREWLVPEQIGIYFVHDLRGVLYIGKTADLRRRFAEHYWICGNELLRLAMRSPVGALLFSWQQYPDEVSCAEAERSLISRFQPVCNRLLLNFTSH